MAESGSAKPKRVEEASQRLRRAVARLEAAVEARAARGGNGSARAIEALRTENAALKETTDVVSRRLDGLIGRLRGVAEA